MKMYLRRKAKTAGHALLVALVIGGILCFTVTGYLTVVQQQTLLSARSQCWNLAITLVEAGIEEGLEHLNVNPTNPGADGWTYADPWYYHTVTFPDGNSYTVYANVTNSYQPVILAKANVHTATFVKTSWLNPGYYFATYGLDANATSSTTVNRAVKVMTSRGTLFTKAMVARHEIDMNGNNILTDSFDSGSPAKSYWGHYKSSYFSGNNGDVASNDTIVNSLTLGNANIYGHISTGPNGTASIGNQGSVGSHAWQAGHTGVEPNYYYLDPGQIWYSHDSNFTFPQTDLPYSSGSSLDGPGDVGIPTNSISSNLTTTATYPSPAPWTGVLTNWYSTNTSSYPGPQANLTTNWNSVTTSSYPGYNPPGGVSTNYLGQQNASGSSDPGTAPPVVPGSVSWNWNNGSKAWSWRTYTSLSYTYNAPSSYSYNQPLFTYNLFTTNTIWTTNHYDHILYSKDYYVTDPAALSGKTIVLGNNAHIAMSGGLSMSGNDKLEIYPGSSITMYVGGTSCSVGGNGVVNYNGYAGSLVIYCAPSVTGLYFKGNGEFVGVLVAPNASLNLDGGGKADNDFIGALVVNSVTMNGHYSFHYDEALGRAPANGRLLITSWDEIAPHPSLPN